MYETADLLHKTPKPPLRVTGAGAYEAPQGKDFPPHQHATWELVYYRVGNIRCPVGDVCYSVQPGTLLLTPPRTVHAEFARTAYANYFVTVDAPDDQPWVPEYLDDADHTLRSLFAALVREWCQAAPGRDRMLGALLEQLDVLLRRMQERRLLTHGERLVRAFEEVVAERFDTPLTVQDIARQIGASSSSLREHFARLRRGRTPLDYLRTVRAERALALLRTSDLTLATIADLCGYASASHLSRHIKEATGRTPGACRAGETV